jgi:hypothetical protein
VRFASGARGIMGYCHCSICRKTSGTLFTTSLNTPRDGFRWLQGRITFEVTRAWTDRCAAPA